MTTNGSQIQSPADLPPETIEFANKIFNLCRNGDLDSVKPFIENGLPVNLRTSKGDSLVNLSFVISPFQSI
jgi:uncharacterized protein